MRTVVAAVEVVAVTVVEEVQWVADMVVVEWGMVVVCKAVV
jgi:hypothetical protein